MCQPTADVLVEQASHAQEVLETAWFADELPADMDPVYITRIPVAFQVYRGRERQPFFDGEPT
ncbi:MAG: hypothetical protein R2932_20650 [Caldilineaceae bacterium]